MKKCLLDGLRRITLALLVATGATASLAELVDNADGTITDTASGLMWLKNANQAGVTMSFAEAQAWVQGINQAGFAGHADWRLPSGASPDGSVCNSQPAGANCTATEFATLYFARTITAYSPGPFVNLQAASYWTATELPGDATRAMGQDFVDGGQNPFNKTARLGVWAVRSAGPLPPGTPQLYGIVASGAGMGSLVRIDSQNGAVSIVGPTGFPQACGLTVDRIRLRAVLSPCFGQVPLHVVDLAAAATTPLGVPSGVRGIAHRLRDDRIYGVDASPALLSVDAATGTTPRVIGYVDKQSVGGIAARPSDGQLFGIGISADGSQKLFKLNAIAGSGRRDSDVGAVSGPPIGGLAFHPDGRLFATAGNRLLTLDPASGATLSSVAMQGAAIGAVGPIAVMGPRVLPPPDVWLKDCPADVGSVPSLCPAPLQSPDLVIDNDGNGTADRLLPNRPNFVRVVVRNRGSGPARGVSVRLLAFEGQSAAANLPAPAAASIDSAASLVGQRQVDVGPPAGEPTVVVFTWSPGARSPAMPDRRRAVRCLAVVLDHPGDRVLPEADIRRDNNKAVHCFGR